MKRIAVGITGPAGSGKSTLIRQLRKRGQVIVADEVNRLVLKKGAPALSGLVSLFGRSLLCPDGSLNRRKAREGLFANPTAFQRWNQVVHPPMREEIVRRLDEAKRRGPFPIFVEAAVLREMGLRRIVDSVWCVWAGEGTRLTRMIRSGWTLPSVVRLFTIQRPFQRFMARAERVIANEMTSGRLGLLRARRRSKVMVNEKG